METGALAAALRFAVARSKLRVMALLINIPWNVSLTPTFFRWAILTHEVGQTDLVFGVQSGFISRSVCARLEVSVCSGYDLCYLS